MGYARIFARAESNPGPPDYSFDDINDVPFYHFKFAICAYCRVVKGISFMSSGAFLRLLSQPKPGLQLGDPASGERPRTVARVGRGAKGR